MYEDIIQLLAEKDVLLESGLTVKEFEIIEETYNIHFPESLKDFLIQVLPVAKGFYNWRDFSDENVAKIKKAIACPEKTVYEDAEEVYWCEQWGREPDDVDEFVQEVRKKLEEAPKLIPVYGHRYMPMDGCNPPIMSIHGIDIIYYGQDLRDYFKVEFGSKKQSEIDFEGIPNIPFWSEIM